MWSNIQFTSQKTDVLPPWNTSTEEKGWQWLPHSSLLPVDFRASRWTLMMVNWVDVAEEDSDFFVPLYSLCLKTADVAVEYTVIHWTTVCTFVIKCSWSGEAKIFHGLHKLMAERQGLLVHSDTHLACDCRMVSMELNKSKWPVHHHENQYNGYACS